MSSIPVELLQRGQYQPRVDMRQDTLGSWPNRFRAQGVVQPIVVRPVASGNSETQRYEIVAGERRWRAAQMAGLHEVPAIIRDIPDEAAIAMALIENIQREDLNPMEEARALDRLIREFDLTHAEAAEAVGRSRAAVSNLLRLLELSDKVKPMLEARAARDGPCPRTAGDHATQCSNSMRPARSSRKACRCAKQNDWCVACRTWTARGKSARQRPIGNADIRRLEDRGVGEARREGARRSHEEGLRQAGYQLQQPR